MWSIFLELSELCESCKCADDVENIWYVFNGIHQDTLSSSEEDMYWNFYDRICFLEDLYNDGRWV